MFPVTQRLTVSNCNRRVAIEGATTDKKAAEIEAAWKWVEPNMESRIRPLFNETVPKAEESICAGRVVVILVA